MVTVASVSCVSVSHGHGHSHGHGIFILATHPEGKWTTNPNPLWPSISAQTQQRALDTMLTAMHVMMTNQSTWSGWAWWWTRGHMMRSTETISFRLHARASNPIIVSAVSYLQRVKRLSDSTPTTWKSEGSGWERLLSRSRDIYFSNASWRKWGKKFILTRSRTFTSFVCAIGGLDYPQLLWVPGYKTLLNDLICRI